MHLSHDCGYSQSSKACGHFRHVVELLTELLRGGLVHKLLSMTLSDVTPQHLSAQDKRVYLAHVLQRGVGGGAWST